MPIIELKRDDLFKHLDQTYTEEEFGQLCFDFGIELDDVTSKYEEIKAEKGENAPELADADKSVLYKIDLPANRYDLLCMEGLTRALRIFEGKDKGLPNYQAILPPEAEQLTMRVTNTTKEIRPYVVCAVLRNIKFTQESYDSFIQLQEKLHFNICRRRSLVAIGTHDLDTLQAPFLYDARAPKDIKFRALREEKEMTADQLFKEYRERDVCPLKPYLPIIEDSPVYPIIYDSNNVVLSMPPIINGEHSKITIDTKNVFIESTATDLTKANIVINTVCAMFAQYLDNPFTVEQVNVVYDEPVQSGDGKELKQYYSPDFTPTRFETSKEYVNKGLGTKLTKHEITNLLMRMGLTVENDEKKDNNNDDNDTTTTTAKKDNNNKDDDDKGSFVVLAPITRSDILHEVDIMEDVAIGYGYNNIIRRLPERSTTGATQIINSLSDKLRECIAFAGYCEVLNWALTSKSENFGKMRIADGGYAVEVSNPKTKEFEICRTNLLPGILRTLSENVGHVPLPLKLFEVGDIVVCDENTIVKARNERRLAAIYCGTQDAGLEIIHGLLDRIMQQNKIEFLSQSDLNSKFNGQWPIYDKTSDNEDCRKRYYSLKASNRPSFFPQRQAAILVDGKIAGYFGMLHPEVPKNFGVMKNENILVSAMEMTAHCFL